MKIKTDILIFVEDPGAANMVLGLPDKLARLGCSATLLAKNHAVKYLRERDTVIFEVLEGASAAQLLDDYPSRAVVIGTSENPDSLGLKLVNCARTRGILSIALVDMLCNAALRFRGRCANSLEYAPDRIVVPDTATRDAYINLGYPVENIALLGHPQYDKVWHRRLELEQIAPDAIGERPRWVFVAEGVDQLDAGASFRSHDYSLDGRGGTDWRTGVVLEEILDAITGLVPKPAIFVRPHPKSNKNAFEQWADEIAFDEIGDPLLSVWQADAVLGMSSMLLVEAAILGRPVLSVLPRQAEAGWLGPLASGQLPFVCCRDDLRDALKRMALCRWPPVVFDLSTAIGSSDRIAEFLAREARQ